MNENPKPKYMIVATREVVFTAMATGAEVRTYCKVVASGFRTIESALNYKNFIVSPSLSGFIVTPYYE
jgi:hypothetical protein